ncbi:MAG: hypothetical protein Q7U52_06795 [Hydrogenophaga sp.]|nr:hypothetical protein [Hydrogenophaga sp.]MDP2163456.1 hypothetical protein [Hydrogenophaga sp.]
MSMMKSNALKLLTLGIALALSTGGALAEKPDHAGGGKPDKWEKSEKGPGKSDRNAGSHPVQHGERERSSSSSSSHTSVNIQIGGYFGEPQRRAALAYYEPQFRAGKCPPGLAKKGNGCMPPGQAKKWRRGYVLPADVIYHSVPNSVSIQIGLPPAGHRYVRVAADILLIAIGTGMVIDAIENLHGL